MNRTDLLVISSYPQKGLVHGAKTVGVASYTKQLVADVVALYPGLKVRVWAEKFGKRASYRESGVRVERVWKRGEAVSMVGMVVQAVLSGSRRVVVSFEAYMFGNLISGVWLWILLFALMVVGKRRVVLLHQVVNDFSVLEKNGVKARILNLMIKAFYRVTVMLADKVVVFEERLKRQLGPGEKVEVIGHLVPEVERRVTSRVAKRRLGWNEKGKYVVYFGYISPYKGVDWLVENWPKDCGYELVIAGGINGNHVGNQKIERFVKSVEEKAKKRGIRVAGFVPENRLPEVFGAATAVILPYRMFFSSSGPLALALAYGKPVLLSQALKEYELTDDFAEAAGRAGLEFAEFSFYLNKSSLKRALGRLGQIEIRMKRFASYMRRLRSQEEVAQRVMGVVEDGRAEAAGRLSFSWVRQEEGRS